MSRTEWLAERRRGIGASDAPAVCGVSPWGNPLSVYLDKLGRLPAKEGAPLTWGLKLEDVLATAYVEETGRPITRPAAIWWHEAIPWMFATLDAITDCERIVELKTSRDAEGWGEPGTDRIPEPYLVQVHHQMIVAEASIADVAVLIAGSDFRVYTVERNEALARRILEIEEAFWGRVMRQDPPPPDWQDPRTPGLVELLHRPVPGKVADLSSIDAMSAFVNYREAGEAERHYAQVKAEAKARLLVEMEDATYGVLPGGLEIAREWRPPRVIQYERDGHFDFRIRKRRDHVSERADEQQGRGAAGSAHQESGTTGNGFAATPDAGANDPGGADGVPAQS